MTYNKLTLKHAVGLAAPHTWVASITPVMVAAQLYIVCGQLSDEFTYWTELRPFISILTLCLIAAVLLQSSVNTLNDYADFIKGTDTKENSDDPSDAVLVYSDINPKSARTLGFVYMLAALAAGAYPALQGFPLTPALGIIGCIIIVAYSAGQKALSHLPLGEAASGITMGCLITCAVYSAFAGNLPWCVPVASIPLVIAIALIMMTNNICDIERDTAAGRKTLPVLLGRKRAAILYRILAVTWFIIQIIMPVIIAPHAAWDTLRIIGTVVYGIIIMIPWLLALAQKMTPENRAAAMKNITRANACMALGYFFSLKLLI